MTKQEFEQRNEPAWRRLEWLVDGLESGRKETAVGEVPALFRQACHDLTLAEHRMYGLALCERLNELIIRAYRQLYRAHQPWGARVVSFFLTGFPRAVRRDWKLFWWAFLFFWGPFFALAFSARHDPRWVESVLGSEGMSAMESMYSGGEAVEKMREKFDSNFQMFGFYIMNNVSIDFKCFAGGIVYGVGALLVLLFNGLQIGAATGYVVENCNPEAFFKFTAGHSSWELLGAVISGMAGMKLGLAALIPGRHNRSEAIRQAAKAALPLILGAAAMTVVAAMIEGFWSAQSLPPFVKYSFGIFWWVFLTVYFSFSGRRSQALE